MAQEQRIFQHTCCVKGPRVFPSDWHCLMAFLRRFFVRSLTLQRFGEKVCQLNSKSLLLIRIC